MLLCPALVSSALNIQDKVVDVWPQPESPEYDINPIFFSGKMKDSLDLVFSYSWRRNTRKGSLKKTDHLLKKMRKRLFPCSSTNNT